MRCSAVGGAAAVMVDRFDQGEGDQGDGDGGCYLRMIPNGGKGKGRGVGPPPRWRCSGGRGRVVHRGQASAPKVTTPRMRSGGMLRGQYHSPPFDRRSQRRGC